MHNLRVVKMTEFPVWFVEVLVKFGKNLVVEDLDLAYLGNHARHVFARMRSRFRLLLIDSVNLR